MHVNLGSVESVCFMGSLNSKSSRDLLERFNTLISPVELQLADSQVQIIINWTEFF